MKKRSLMERIAAVPHALWSVLFIVVPLLIVVYYSFTDSNFSFTLSNFSELGKYSRTFLMSVGFAFIATLICFLIGFPLAYCMSRMKPSQRKVLMVLLMLPMWISLLIRTYSLMALLDNGGIINRFLEMLNPQWKIHIVGTEFGVILGMIYDFLPYMVLPIFTVMSKIDEFYYESAADLGCNRLQTIIKVIFPMSLPGIISGVTMVFVPSISTFYISQKLGGGTFDLIGDAIERQFIGQTNFHVGAAMSLVMMILILISLAIMNRYTDGDEGGIIV